MNTISVRSRPWFVLAPSRAPAQETQLPMELTPRERDIAALIATGASNKEIARELEISVKTVKNTLTHVFEKTNTRSRSELAVGLVRSAHAALNAERAAPVCQCARCPLASRGCPRA